MGKVIMNAAVSLDGYIAHDDDMPGALFDFYSNGPVPFEFAGGGAPPATMTQASVDFYAELVRNTGVTLIGRRLFDITDGWQGNTVAGDHVVVVTHEPPTDWAYAEGAPFRFASSVREGVELARELAGDRDVSLSAGDVAAQALREGLVDQVVLSLVPVVLGSGRPYFGSGGPPEVLLENPSRVVQGDRVTHLVYDVRR
jgi:dihydrofolate reductase